MPPGSRRWSPRRRPARPSGHQRRGVARYRERAADVPCAPIPARRNCASVARRRTRQRSHRQVQPLGRDGRQQLRLVVAALASPGLMHRDRDQEVAAGATSAHRRASAWPSGIASRRSPAYFRTCSARRTVPSKGAHQSSCSSGAGTSLEGPAASRPGARGARPAPADSRRTARRPRARIRRSRRERRVERRPDQSPDERRHRRSSIVGSAHPGLPPTYPDSPPATRNTRPSARWPVRPVARATRGGTMAAASAPYRGCDDDPHASDRAATPAAELQLGRRSLAPRSSRARVRHDDRPVSVPAVQRRAAHRPPGPAGVRRGGRRAGRPSSRSSRACCCSGTCTRTCRRRDCRSAPARCSISCWRSSRSAATAAAPSRVASLRLDGVPTLLNLVVMLAVIMGPAAFVLTATTPLMSSWYARVRRAADASASESDPYWLYALSNGGSFVALLAYPFVVGADHRADRRQRSGAGSAGSSCS